MVGCRITGHVRLVCELPRLVDDFAGRAAELAWVSELAYAESPPGASVVGLITSSGGMGKTTLAVRAAHMLRPSFPGGVFFLDLLGMSQQPMAAGDALRLLLRALGADPRRPLRRRLGPPRCQDAWNRHRSNAYRALSRAG